MEGAAPNSLGGSYASFEAARKGALQTHSEAHMPPLEVAREGGAPNSLGGSYAAAWWGWLANLLLNYRWIFFGLIWMVEEEA